HGLNNFFVLAPNLTIYNKLIADFTPNTPKYVFKGIAEFAVNAPIIITGDNYNQKSSVRSDLLPGSGNQVHINIFNISKINSEVRGGKSPRIKRLSEYIGQSYFDYLAALPDLVLLMDESHRYRASAGVKAINDLKPLLGLELTATPFIESARGPVPFKNVVLDYPLGRAMADGFVKEPAVVTRKDFNPASMQQEEIERLKLEDGVRLHEQTKVLLETYARETGERIVKPFMLVIARDTTHAGQLIDLIQSDAFFEGRYRDKVIQVDSSQTGAKEDEMVERLLKVEHNDEPTEIVIHVNMLKEGWDVTNLYTIVPLRAANARTLIEQSIGRGLRLPYGHRTGVAAVDRLNIVAHDRFQEIVNEANRSDSPIRLQQVILADDEIIRKTKTVVSQPIVERMLGIQPDNLTSSTEVASSQAAPVFTRPEEQRVAQITYEVIRKLENQPSASHLKSAEMQARISKEVEERWRLPQMELEGIVEKPDVASIVARTTDIIVQQTIDIPRILVVPQGEVRAGYKAFTLNLAGVRYQPPSDDLWLQYLRTGGTETIGFSAGGIIEKRLEDYIVSALMDCNDVSYDEHADLLYDLAGQTVAHFQSYLSDEEDVHKVLRMHRREIAALIHAQMQKYYWEETADYDVVISKGFTDMKGSAYATSEPDTDYKVSPPDKSNMAKYLFGGFQRCLYPVQKFHAEGERILAVILERDVQKWFKPAKGQFQLFYKSGAQHPEYQPDFVAETDDAIYMLEPKARNQMSDSDVLAKKDAAVLWCQRASVHTATYGGKPWKYALIPHDQLATNMTLEALVQRFGCD
ncbi:MAG: DEAD/DEAH box helicase family protein, partial [Mariprofundaceae bacterium]|nr:DEAD/DEAH box helicase family protein [Mariprofundaceae bacterium]